MTPSRESAAVPSSPFIDTTATKRLRAFLAANPGRTTFLEHELKGLLRECGMTVPRGVFITRDAGLVPTAHISTLRYPLVVKVSSGRISSKSDVRGIVTGIDSPQALQCAVDDVRRIDSAEGVLIEEMAAAGTEVVIGGIVDRQFGPVVMFGLGGVLVELFRDVEFGLAPLGRDEALAMIDTVKGGRLLRGYRGRPAGDVSVVADIMVLVSQMMATGLVEEIDLNPVVVYASGAVVLDAKMRRIHDI